MIYIFILAITLFFVHYDEDMSTRVLTGLVVFTFQISIIGIIATPFILSNSILTYNVISKNTYNIKLELDKREYPLYIKGIFNGKGYVIDNEQEDNTLGEYVRYVTTVYTTRNYIKYIFLYNSTFSKTTRYSSIKEKQNNENILYYDN